MLKIKVPILGRRPGETISEGDKDFKVFAAWAERKDRRGGMVICEPFIDEAAASADAAPAGDTGPEGEKSDGEVKGAEDDEGSVSGATEGDLESEDASADADLESADAATSNTSDTTLDNTPPVADKPKVDKGGTKKPKK